MHSKLCNKFNVHLKSINYVDFLVPLRLTFLQVRHIGLTHEQILHTRGYMRVVGVRRGLWGGAYDRIEIILITLYPPSIGNRLLINGCCFG